MPEQVEESVQRARNRGMRSSVLLRNELAVLVQVAEKPRATLGELAVALGVKTRTVPRLLNRVEDAGYLKRTQVGRGRLYTVNREKPIADGARGCLGDLLDLLRPA